MCPVCLLRSLHQRRPSCSEVEPPHISQLFYKVGRSLVDTDRCPHTAEGCRALSEYYRTPETYDYFYLPPFHSRTSHANCNHTLLRSNGAILLTCLATGVRSGCKDMAWFSLSRPLVLAGWTCLRRSKAFSRTFADSISVLSLAFTFPAASLDFFWACLIAEKAPAWHRDNKHCLYYA